MFCLGCGAELGSRAELCGVCGRPAHPESPLSPRRTERASTNLPLGPTPSMEFAAIPFAPARAPTPSVSSGDLAMFALPRDVTSRLVVALPLLMVADLLAPWVVFGEAHLAPARLGLLVVILALLCGLVSAMALYLPFRQRPILAAIPLVIASLTLGGGAVLLLAVGPLGSRIVSIIGAGTLAHLNPFIASGTPPSDVTPLTLTPDIGLYAFVACAAALVVATYRRLDALIAGYHSLPAQAETGVLTPAVADNGASGVHDSNVEVPARASAPTAATVGEKPARPAATLPGTPGWTQAPELPGIVRNAPSIRGLRRVNPRG
jgi:hypothetical protein